MAAGVASGGIGAATPIDDGLWMIDLGFQGQPGVIAAYLLAGNGELALIETGPASTLEALRAGVRAAGFDPARIDRVLVSHIHLDHSGGAWALADAAPALTVHVHPIGAPHLIDPARLWASASRLYGDRMETLWGEAGPIAAERVVPLTDGETLSIAGRVVVALDTPGHASHHLAVWDARGGTVFTGDVGGGRVQGTGWVCPPTPPPDLDLDAWAGSVARLGALGARRLCPTHFGPFEDVAEHLGQLLPNLAEVRDLAAAVVAAGGGEAELTARLHARYEAALAGAPPGALATLEWASPSYVGAPGLLRYLRQRAG